MWRSYVGWWNSHRSIRRWWLWVRWWQILFYSLAWMLIIWMQRSAGKDNIPFTFLFCSTDPISAKLQRSMKLRHTPIPTSVSVGADSALWSANVQTAVMVIWSISPRLKWTAVRDLQRTHHWLAQRGIQEEGLVEVIHTARNHWREMDALSVSYWLYNNSLLYFWLHGQRYYSQLLPI